MTARSADSGLALALRRHVRRDWGLCCCSERWRVDGVPACLCTTTSTRRKGSRCASTVGRAFLRSTTLTTMTRWHGPWRPFAHVDLWPDLDSYNLRARAETFCVVCVVYSARQPEAARSRLESCAVFLVNTMYRYVVRRLLLPFWPPERSNLALWPLPFPFLGENTDSV